MVFQPNFENATLENGTTFSGNIKYFYELPMAWALEQEEFTNEKEMWILILKDHKSRLAVNSFFLINPFSM